MGTRSLTFVYDTYKAKNGRAVHRPIINLYRQYDGYPEGHGQELVDFLKQFTLTNGLVRESGSKTANGMPCLAAQLVHHFKGSVGGEESIAMKGRSPNLAGQFYLEPITAKECGQDYEYHIYSNGPTFRVKIVNKGWNAFGLTMSDTNDVIFDGILAKAEEFCAEKEQA